MVWPDPVTRLMEKYRTARDVPMFARFRRDAAVELAEAMLKAADGVQ